MGKGAWAAKSETSLTGQFEQPYGALRPYSTFTLPVMAFLHERGYTQEALAEVVVAQREWAIPNERAGRRKPTTVEVSMLSIRRRAWSSVRTGVLPRLIT